MPFPVFDLRRDPNVLCRYCTRGKKKEKTKGGSIQFQTTKTAEN
jgi:hypothetical protein